MRLIKAHALGNDFLLASRRDMPSDTASWPELARRACHRHHGIGADGLMLLAETSAGAESQLFNADGSAAEVSGNGVRCAAAWLAESRRLTPNEVVTITTVAGPKRLELKAVKDGRWTFRADMGQPSALRRERLDVRGIPIDVVTLHVGNPQCVVLGSVTVDRLHAIAGPLAIHPHFPEGTNVELALVESPTVVRVLIWERGVGPTEASGTGACAAAVAAAFAGGAARESDVISPGGTQHVEWTDAAMFLTGWAEIIATIDWRLPAID
jgi:diaminopimelate epimerase